MKKLLIVDNYDSFVYNIPQVISRTLDLKVDVVRNDKLTERHFDMENYTHVIISPGPGCPTKQRDFGRCREIIAHYQGNRPMLGICLGHQGVAYHYGGQVVSACRVMHGETSNIKICSDSPLWHGVKDTQVMRYHSLVVAPDSLPVQFEPTAVTDDDHQELMGFQNLKQKIFALQFHPESIATPDGESMLTNFINFDQ